MLVRVTAKTVPLKSRLVLEYDEFIKVKHIIPVIYLSFSCVILVDIIFSLNNLFYNLVRNLVFICALMASLFILIKIAKFSKANGDVSEIDYTEVKWLGLEFLYLSILLTIIRILVLAVP